MKVNPFKPNSPVSTGMFAGRLDEIIELEKGLFQTKNGYPVNYLITGERGIGKSSLMMYLKHVSCGNIKGLNTEKFNYVTINTIISDKTNLISFIKLIEKQISREIGKLEVVKKFLKETWAFAQRIKVLDSGIEGKKTIDDIDILIDEFAYSLAETCKRITNPMKDEEKKDGIIFLMDEADNASENLEIGYFFKTLTELLQQYECNNIMFVVAGLPEIIEKLSASHQSSIRVFNELKIKELTPEDRKYVISRGIEIGNEINTEQTTITDNAKTQISTLSEGYPHFIQQFAFSAFDHSIDNEISNDDVLDGAFKQGGAIDAIGNKYYANAYFDQIKSDDYRKVLGIMAEEMNTWIKKNKIREKFDGTDAILSNALQTLTTKKIILKNSSKIGEYRLQHRGFALWIRLFGNRQK